MRHASGALGRALAGLVLLLAVSACGADDVYAPDAAVERLRYRGDGPPALTLYTVISNSSEGGAHSGLVVDASERVVFDPAGTWHQPGAPERYDVHHGFTPVMEENYVDYHARKTFRVVRQHVEVPPEVAEQALIAVRGNGAVPKAFCTRATSRILSRLPGFGSISTTFFPKRLMRQMDRIPGVTRRLIRDDDADDNTAVLVGAPG